MILIAGIDSFGRITDFEINAAFKTRFLFKNRNADILRYTRINRGFIYNNRAFCEVATEHLACADNGRKVGNLIGTNRSRHGYNMKPCLSQSGFIAREIDIAFLYSLVADLLRRVLAADIGLDFLIVYIKSDNINLFRKSNGNGQSDIAETDQRKLFFSVDNFIV